MGKEGMAVEGLRKKRWRKFTKICSSEIFGAELQPFPAKFRPSLGETLENFGEI